MPTITFNPDADGDAFDRMLNNLSGFKVRIRIKGDEGDGRDTVIHDCYQGILRVDGEDGTGQPSTFPLHTANIAEVFVY